jgi:hypothetical protein
MNNNKFLTFDAGEKLGPIATGRPGDTSKLPDIVNSFGKTIAQNLNIKKYIST